MDLDAIGIARQLALDPAPRTRGVRHVLDILEDDAQLAGRLLPVPPLPGDPRAFPRGDHDHQSDPLPVPDESTARPAAVLVPVIARADGPNLLLTLRTARLARHAGQIAFPGGRIDPEDDGPLAAALREAREEIGLDPAFVRPLGFLDPYLSSTGYRIMPVVARVAGEASLTANPDEVDDIFEVPLRFLLEPANHQRQSREWNGRARSFYAMPWESRYIWGVTAGIIRNLYERLARE